MVFDKKYFDDIWGSVHRHDYCAALADSLIAKYSPKSVFDIGTGCGYLVKVLRDKGVEAYGLEISEYAVENSHGNVLLGSVTDIPFKDGRFDLVHSQGLWEYIKEENIPKAWAECLRVGRKQEHNFDYEGCDNPPEHQKVTIKPLAWWQTKMQLPRILIACPVFDGKEYAMQRWIDNISKFTYPNYDVLLVDNSGTLAFYDRWKAKVPMVHVNPMMTNGSRHDGHIICQSMEVIRQKFIRGHYAYWFNLEIDIITPKDMIEFMLSQGKNCDWMTHSFPGREGGILNSFGISLFSRKVMLSEFFDKKDFNNSCDGWYWDKIRDQDRWKAMELWSYRKITHLRE